ncbi:CrcB-like protein-domain-containing protein [Bisporella sp. PMI_857]|nr:CrcB-like protein-domain-containing protein [Bisporella sp. PMI_857]
MTADSTVVMEDRIVSHRQHQQPQDPKFDVPEVYANLDDLVGVPPVRNPEENPVYLHRSLKEEKDQVQEPRKFKSTNGRQPEGEKDTPQVHEVSKLATHLYTISYLILFSFLGTLARLGLQGITLYPGAPVIFSELWANFGGSLFFGFLAEDRMLFKEEWGTPAYHQQLERERQKARGQESGSPVPAVDLAAAKKAHTATKKTIPLYIGLTTGFCGCFTSFSSFIRDAYLALANNLETPSAPIVHRNGGRSIMAVLAVTITTVAVCISGLYIGAHIAIASEQYTPSLPFRFGRKVLDRLAVFFAWGCWIGAIFLAIFPPDLNSRNAEVWRGRAVFAMVFSPLGCLARFYASLKLNGKILSFPLGTFLVNIFGTAILGMSYDLQHVPLGGIIGCQVLQGIQDGFCGCLTTVSTWVSELATLRRRHSYRYGTTSVIVALCFLIVIMGSMQWTRGFSNILCIH